MTVCSMHDGTNVKRAAVGGELDRKKLLKRFALRACLNASRDSMEQVSKGRLGPLVRRKKLSLKAFLFADGTKRE